MKLKVSSIEFPKKEPHKWKRLAHIILHDADAKISFHTFDLRYTGPNSRLGKYLKELHSQGVDISGLGDTKTSLLTKSKKEEEIVMTMAKRLYEALVKRTIFEKLSAKNSKTLVTKKDESWDWNKPAAKSSKYYLMAERILAESDPDTAMRIVNLITGYA